MKDRTEEREIGSKSFFPSLFSSIIFRAMSITLFSSSIFSMKERERKRENERKREKKRKKKVEN